MRVLLLSAYAARSHAHWRRSLQAMMPDWDWTVLELPPRHFSWRVRGNPLYWSLEQQGVLKDRYDLLLATSMVDLATLRGLVPTLAELPSVLYFHENQFDYPPGRSKHSPLEAQMVSLYAALAADRLLFNSVYNRNGFLQGCARLLARLPDKVPPGVVDLLEKRSRVLPVALGEDAFETGAEKWPGADGRDSEKPLRLLWTGRFEYDKGGEQLREVLGRLERSALSYELALVGQQFRDSPPVFGAIEREFSHRLVHCGYLDSRLDYRGLLAGADVVLSTALHEFQGLAVLEAVAAACIPVVPDRLAYRELYAREYRYESAPSDPALEADSAAACVMKWARALRIGVARVPDVSAFRQQNLAGLYRAELGGCVRLDP